MDELNPGQKIEESLIQRSDSSPQVVDESGKLLDRSDIVAIATQLAQVAQLAKIRKSLEKEEFGGRLLPINIAVTDVQSAVAFLIEWPYVSLATLSLFNDGPNTAWLSINNAADWIEIRNGEPLQLDFTKADKRISYIYHVCAPGNTATMRGEGKY